MLDIHASSEFLHWVGEAFGVQHINIFLMKTHEFAGDEEP